MDYFIITLATVCFAAQFAFTKLYEKSVRQTMITSLVMLVVTSVIGTLLYLFIGAFSVKLSYISIFWAVVFALVMIPYYMIGIKVLTLGSLAIYSMFMMLGGMLVPFFYGIIFLGEGVTPGKLAGTVLLTLFIVLQAVWQKPSAEEGRAVSAKGKALFFIFCLLIFILNGLTGVIAKAHQISEGAVDEVSFTVISCAITAALSAALLPFGFIRNRRSAIKDVGSTLKLRPMWVMSLIGAATYTGNFLHLKAASTVPASVQFPLVSGGVIVLSAILSAVAFKEKASWREWISVGGAFAATVLFAF